MKKLFIILALVLFTNVVYSQDVLPECPKSESSSTQTVKMNLLPNNIIQYVGKVTQNEFERIVGSPVDIADGVIVYQVENTYDNEITAIRCQYNETTGKLTSVTFGTIHYLGYWLKFSDLKGYTEKDNCQLTKVDNILTKVNLWVKGFGCQILDITRVTPNETTAIINYYVR